MALQYPPVFTWATFRPEMIEIAPFGIPLTPHQKSRRIECIKKNAIPVYCTACQANPALEWEEIEETIDQPNERSLFQLIMFCPACKSRGGFDLLFTNPEHNHYLYT
jgi:hypothetical protein